MKTLDLAYPENSDIKFIVSHFPDGQQDVKINTSKVDLGHYDEDKYWVAKPVLIKSRFNSFKDLELILCATEALKRAGSGQIHLFIPYLLGARSDRKFTDGGTSYLVDVIAPILNAQEYKTIHTIDAHSDVAAACINNLIVETNVRLAEWAIRDIYAEIPESNINEKLVLVSPDAGSLKKIYKVGDSIGFKGEVLICSKFRDWEGNLSRVDVPLKVNQWSKDLVIIDDICDGGNTFLEIAKAVDAQRGKTTGRLFLVVTHGIFSKGLDTLAKSFNGIYCTNSVIDYPTELTSNFIKQLNVFNQQS